MPKGLVNESSLNSIAEAINVLNGTEGTYIPSEMGEAIIDAIPTETAEGNPVHITDAAAYPAESVVTTLEPVQDLHGYDKPWAGGTGKNLLPMTVAGIKAANTSGTWSGNEYTYNGITFTLNTDSDGNVISIKMNGTASPSNANIAIPVTDLVSKHTGDSVKACIGGASSGQTDYRLWFGTSSYADVAVTTGSDYTFTVPDTLSLCWLQVYNNNTVSNLTIYPMVRLASVSDDTFAPYSNECPISGHTGVELTRTGKNLFDKTKERNPTYIADLKDALNAYKQYGYYARGYISSGTTITANNSYYMSFTRCSPNTTYTISGASFSSVLFLDDVGNIISRKNGWFSTPYTHTTASNEKYIAASFDSIYLNDIQLELGSTATSYESYQGTSIPITFPAAAGTVYGGKVDVVNGKLTAYPEYDSYNGETLTSEWISDRDAYVAGTTPTIGAQVVDLSGVGTEYDLTPQQVQMLLGDNNIWCDTGDTSLKYKVDLATYIREAEDDDNLDNLINAWMTLGRTGKVYQVKIPKFESNTSTICVKTLDNAGLIAEPSTDTTKGRDDYLDIPLFKWYRCNYIRDAKGVPYVTAVEGDTNFTTTGNVDIGSFGMSFYFNYDDTSDNDWAYLTISDTPNKRYNLKPWVGCLDENGKVRPYWCYSAYHGLWSKPDVAPYIYKSFANIIPAYQTKGAGYWGADIDKWTFTYIMMLIKYANKSSQNVFMGCTEYNYQYTAADKTLTNVKYFPLTDAQAANIIVGSCVEIGYSGLNTSTGALNNDRGTATMHAYANCVKVTKKQASSTAGITNVYVDIATGFNTADVDVSTTTYPDKYAPVYISTMPWYSGATDRVIGKHDGSPVNNSNGTYPFRIMGIECATGAWEVVTNCAMNINSDYSTDFYVAKRGVSRTTTTSTITSTYIKAGTMSAAVGGNSSFWIGDETFNNVGLGYPTKRGTGNSVGVGDYCYCSGTGWREPLLGGNLRDGSTAGLRYLHCGCGLSYSSWSFAASD